MCCRCVAVCCRCVAVWCSVLQCVAVWCSVLIFVLQCAAVCDMTHSDMIHMPANSYSFTPATHLQHTTHCVCVCIYITSAIYAYIYHISEQPQLWCWCVYVCVYICVTRPSSMFDMTHSRAWQRPSICCAWFVCMWKYMYIHQSMK